jgi:N-acetylmuramoyl-L-alanine amidase
MSFTQRVAAIATMTFGIAGLIGASAPGFAAQLDRTVNAGVAATVPQAGPISAVLTTIQPLPAQPDAAKPTPPASDAQGNADSFDSLAAAVAARRDALDVDAQLTCLAGAVYFESKGEPLDGQLAVAKVILNRTKSGRFPKSVCSVVTQPGQFSFVRGGQVPAVANNAAYRTALAVARVAMDDGWESPVADAMYFHARRVAPGWHRVQVASIGRQLFYR